MSLNLPPRGALYLDHTGHFVADAEAARAALRDLGFTVTPFSAQVYPDPLTGEDRLTGTGNVCVMLPEGYLEFLVHTADTPLGLEFRGALTQRAGLHLLAFGSSDTAERHAALVEAGYPMRPIVHFSREVETQAEKVSASFTVARLRAGTMPEGRVQICTHHTEAAMWQPRWTTHPNGAMRLEAIVLSTPDPEATVARYAAFLGVVPEGACLTLDRGRMEVLSEAECAGLIGTTVAKGEPVFAAVRVAVRDLDLVQDWVSRSGQGGQWKDSALVVPFAPALGRGAWIFEQI